MIFIYFFLFFSTLHATDTEQVQGQSIPLNMTDLTTGQEHFEQGKRLMLGQETPVDIEKAFDSFLIASSTHDDNLEWIAESVQKLKKSKKESAITKIIEFYSADEWKNTLRGMYYLGLGHYLKQDFSQSLNYFESAINAYDGDNGTLFYAHCLSRAGSIYRNAKGVEQDITKAVELYQKAADLNNPAALHDLGSLYFYGQYIPEDKDKAMEYMEKAADLGYVHALTALGRIYRTQGQTQKFIDYHQKAADLGHLPALLVLGNHYKRLAKEYEEKGFEYLKKMSFFSPISEEEEKEALAMHLDKDRAFILAQMIERAICTPAEMKKMEQEDAQPETEED